MNRTNIKKRIDLPVYLLVLSVFSKELFSINIAGVSVDLLSYTFSLIYFVVNFTKLNLPKNYFITAILIFLSSIVSYVVFNYNISSFIKVFIPVVIVFSTAYDIVAKRLKYLFTIFKLYLDIAYLVAIFGLIQWSLSMIGVNVLIRQRGFLDSITYEPSHYAVVVLPAGLYWLKNFKENIRAAVIINLSLFLTFSFTAYFVPVIAMFISYLHYRNASKLVYVAAVTVLLFSFAPDRVKERLDTVITSYSDKFDYKDKSTNLTMLSFLSNLDVAKFSLEKNPLTGSGMGAHKYVYDEYYKNDYIFKAHPRYGINSIASHSMALRIIAELGLMGMVIYGLFLTKNYIKYTKINSLNHYVSLAVMAHFFAKAIKLSGYIDYGTPFFVAVLLLNRVHQERTKLGAV